METPTSLTSAWPLFGLRIETPRLTLVYPTDAQIAELGALAAAGIHPEDEMPFLIPWTRNEPLQRQRSTMQYHWRSRAMWKPSDWTLPLITVVDRVVVGTQDISGECFAVTRAVGTGSWLGRDYQGKGIGREMRAAVLHLAFAGLGTAVAYTSAFKDNRASLGVTRSLGYIENGTQVTEREGKPGLQLRFRLEREIWERRRRDDITIVGLESCLELFGV